MHEIPQASGDEPEKGLQLELACESFADLVQRLEVAKPTRRRLVQPRVLDGDRRLRCEQLDELLVFVGELFAALLFGEVEIPVCHPTKQDGHAEERLHRRVVRRESDGPRVGPEVRKPERSCLPDEHAEDPSSLREIADRRVRLRVDAGCQEPFECCASLIDDAQGRVAGAGQKRRLLDELLEQRVERELGAQCDPRIHEDAQAIQCGLLGHLSWASCAGA